MKSVILISTNDKEVEHLFQQWGNKATNFMDNDHRNIMRVDDLRKEEILNYIE